jgi:WD40 repeat protein
MGLLDQRIFPFGHKDGKALRDILPKLYRPARALSLGRLASAPVELINFEGPATEVWEDVLRVTAATGCLRELARVIVEDRESLAVRPLLERLLAEPEEEPVVQPQPTELAAVTGQAGPPALARPDLMHEVRMLEGHAGWVTCLAFSPDGTQLASADHYGRMLLWDLTADNSEGRLLTGHLGAVNSVAFNHDGTALASGGADHDIRIWEDLRGPVTSWVLPGHASAVLSVVFNNDGTLLASCSADTTVRLWNLAGPGTRNQIIGQHSDMACRVVFNSAGSLLASAGADRTVRVWKMPFTGAARILNGHSGRVSGIAFSPDGSQLVSADWVNHSLIIWNSETGEEKLLPPASEWQDWVPDIAFSPNGLLASAGYCDGSIRLWETANLTMLCQLSRHRGPVSSLAFSRDGHQLASGGGRDHAVRIWR